jgi:carbonic anhydrase
MNNLDSMLERNKDFAAQQSAAGTLMPSLPRALPNVKAVIIGCADMRVDPAHVLGIKPGEAVVMRNIGGRITPGLLEHWVYSGESVHLPERFLGVAGSFTSSYCSTPIAV